MSKKKIKIRDIKNYATVLSWSSCAELSAPVKQHRVSVLVIAVASK